jgi:hypothetical protein
MIVVVETGNLRIRAWLALRHCVREHLGIMDHDRAAWVRTSLTPWDITAVRFGAGAVILLPYLLRKGLSSIALDGWDWRRLLQAAGHRWCWFPVVVCYSRRQDTPRRYLRLSYPCLPRSWLLSCSATPSLFPNGSGSY